MTQKASFLPALNAKLTVEDKPILAPGTNQVLIKITAAAINPVDHWHRSTSSHIINKYPAILGCDGAGVVEAVGTDVHSLKQGDRVRHQLKNIPRFFPGNFGHDGATFQQYALADASLVARIPSSISDDQASTLPVALATAITLLFYKTEFKPPIEGPTVSNTPIVILGGSGSVGRSVIQLAHIAGFSPIITTSSKPHAEALKSFGATHVFERTVTAETIHSIIQATGHALPLVADAVSTPETQVFAFKLLTNQPNPPNDLQLQLVLPPSDELLALNKARPEGPIKADIIFGSAYAFKELCAPFYGVAEKWLEEGKLLPAQVQIVEGGLGAVSEALDLIAKGVSGVKLVIRPQE
ncbi:hypothetical protein FRC10_002323 [Ceratobasidium sp. 414]|nr:hypothetical protein FRC10_002323 [Ceratobasidium sp. 414]